MRGRRGGGVNPLWAKAPFVLLRFPGLLLALLAGTLLLALSVAAYPLFISSIASDLVSAKVDEQTTTRNGAGIVYHDQALPLEGTVPGDPSTPLSQGLLDRFSARTSAEPLLGPAFPSMVGPDVNVSTPQDPNRRLPARLFASPDAYRHIRWTEGAPGDGVWLPEWTADGLGLRTGDAVSIQYSQRSTVQVRVDGVYRSLFSEPTTGYWHEWNSDIYPKCLGDCPLPPPFVLLAPHQFITLSHALGVHRVEFALQAPIAPAAHPTLDQATQLMRFTGKLASDMRDRRTEIGRVFRCCPLYYAAGYPHQRADLSSDMHYVVTGVQKHIAALESPGRLLQIAGMIVALAIIAAAGAFALAARRIEAQLLFARGAGAGTVAARAALESAIPSVIGAAIGLGLTFVLVRAAGPGGPVAASAARGAALAVVLTVPLALVLLSAVAAVSSVRVAGHRRGLVRGVAGLPWEVALLAVAAYALRRLLTGGAFVQDRVIDVRRPSMFLLLFAVLAIAGVAPLAARLFAAALRWLRGRSRSYRAGLYLAIHRLAGAARPTLLLVSASALCLGIFVQGQVMVRSLRATVDAKAGVFVGSDVEGKMLYETPLPDRFPLPLTRVTRVPQPGTLAPGGEYFDLLAVDPATVAAAAFWDHSFSGDSLQTIARNLAGPSDRSLPVVIAGENAPAPAALVMQGREVPVRIVARARAFPGMSSFRPLLVVDAASLLDHFADLPNPLAYPAGASTEFWVKGPTAVATADLERLRYAPYLVLTADQIKDVPEIAAVIDTFAVLNGLGLVAASLVLIGMLMYLQARQRSQVVSYGLSLRMGMSHATHRRSLVTEVGMMLGYACVVALGAAVATAVVIVSRMDPLSSIPPATFLVLPARLMALIVVAALAVSWVAGWFTNRLARRMDLGTVMRLAD